MNLRQSIKLLNEVIISFGIELGWDSYRDVSVAFKGASFAHDFYIFVIYFFVCIPYRLESITFQHEGQ